ncbi:MAG: cytochrome c [Planctomycetes bacterium]|nr:cytochrome c [Planctomycetota bacterium]
MKITILSALLLAVTALLAVGCGGDNAAPSNRGKKADDTITRPEVIAEYKGKEKPATASAEEGKKLFDANCATCHGPTGAGDGPLGKALNPPAGDLSNPKLHDAVGDDYLFWRISEGGGFAPFNSGMTPFKGTFNEEQRWHVVAYVRTLKK